MTTGTTYLPTSFGPVESARQTSQMTGALTTLQRTIIYGYDNLYHLTSANYTSGEQYSYAYDPVGNRLQQIIDGDTTGYLYDAANRLISVNGQTYTFDDKSNLLTTGAMTNTWDAANRLIETTNAGATLQPIYDGLGNRVAQVMSATTTTFAVDTALALPEVVYSSEGHVYLHLPGLIVTENLTGDARYLLSDGLGSIRQVVDENAMVVSYKEFDPYGSPIQGNSDPYGYTGEWWEDEVGLLYLRARWYMPETGTFLSRDSVEGEPPYAYVRGNVVNLTDPTGLFPEWCRNMSIKPFYAMCVLGRYLVLPATLESTLGASVLRPTTIPAFFDPALILPIANLPGHLSPATLSAFFDPALLTEIKGHSGCYGGPVPYKTTGYLEGAGGYIMLGQLGKEVTYDFAFMQRQLFKYSGIGVSDAAAGVGYAEYFGFANGFRSNVEISTDYRGPFILVPGGVSGTIPPFADIGIGLGIGGVAFSAPNGSIYGTSFYLGINLAGDPLPFIDIGVAYVTYEAEPPINPPPYFNADGTVDLTRLVRDIRSGTDSPWRTGALASIQWIARDIAISSATYLAKVHDEIYVNSSL